MRALLPVRALRAAKDGSLRRTLGGRHGVGRRAKKVAVPEGLQAEAPVHSKAVACVDLAKLREEMEAGEWAQFAEVWAAVCEPGAGVEADVRRRCRERCAAKAERWPEPRAEDVAALERDGVVERWSGDAAVVDTKTTWCLPFFVFEEKAKAEYAVWGGRRRWILWSLEANMLLGEAGYRAELPGLATAGDVEDGVRCGAVGGQRDLVAGFYQLALPATTCYIFRAGGEWWRMARLPMGLVVAPEVCHRVLRAMAGAALRAEAAVARTVHVATYIDNLRVCGAAGEVATVLAAFDGVTKRVRATTEAEEASEVYTFLGIECDHRRGWVKAGSKTAKKMAAVKVETGAEIELGELEQFGGRLWWAATLLSGPLGEYLAAAKAIRRAANAMGRGESERKKMRLTAAEARAMKKWRDEVTRGRSVKALGDEGAMATNELWCDASTKGMGCVVRVAGAGGWRSYGRRWTEKEQKDVRGRSGRVSDGIVLLEAKAMVEAMREQREVPGRWVIWGDNAALIAAVRRGYSWVGPLNAAVVEIRREMRRLRATVSWVCSGDNLADRPSRDVCAGGA